MYVEINLYYGVKEAAETLGFDLNEGCDSQAVYAELDRYFREFAADYGIDADNIFAGGIFCEQLSPVSSAWASMKFYGEFETSTIEKMLGDERVESIYKNHRGNYIYEERSGMYSNPTIVTKEQLIAIPANTSYGDIVETLGHTAQYGYDSLHVYLTDDMRAIIIDFDVPEAKCPLSGEEIYNNALSFEPEDKLAVKKANWSKLCNYEFCLVIKDNLCMALNDGQVLVTRMELCDSWHNGINVDQTKHEFIHEDKTPATKYEIFTIGNLLYAEGCSWKDSAFVDDDSFYSGSERIMILDNH